jgi:hypothetical protein
MGKLVVVFDQVANVDIAIELLEKGIIFELVSDALLALRTREYW